jgi:hypothetical protein
MGMVLCGQDLHANSVVSKYYVPVQALALAVSSLINLCPCTVIREQSRTAIVGIIFHIAICALVI